MGMIGEVCLLTRDVRRLANFYRMLLRLALVEDGDETHQFVLPDETMLTVQHDERASGDGDAPRICLAFTVEDVDAETARVNALGARVLEPPATRPWGARNAHILDPDGNHVYLRSLVQ